MRAVGGVSLLIVSAILIRYDVWWGLLLVPLAALNFYSAYRFPQAIRAMANSTRDKHDARITVQDRADRV